MFTGGGEGQASSVEDVTISFDGGALRQFCMNNYVQSYFILHVHGNDYLVHIRRD